VAGRPDDTEDDAGGRGGGDDDDGGDDRSPVPGVREIDHTADVALEVEAPDMATLFERAGRGTVWLLFGRVPDHVEEGEARSVERAADDLPSLLRDWLQDVVFWHETEGWVFRSLGKEALSEDDDGRARLAGPASGGVTRQDPVREIKGVTRHGLVVERRGDRWFARVVFDV